MQNLKRYLMFKELVEEQATYEADVTHQKYFG
jgi:hypothetical protein